MMSTHPESFLLYFQSDTSDADAALIVDVYLYCKAHHGPKVLPPLSRQTIQEVAR